MTINFTHMLSTSRIDECDREYIRRILDLPAHDWDLLVHELLTSDTDIGRVNGCTLYILSPPHALVTVLFTCTLHIRNPSLTHYGMIALIQTWPPHTIALRLIEHLEKSTITDHEIIGIQTLFYCLGGINATTWCRQSRFLYFLTELTDIVDFVRSINHDLAPCVYIPDLVPHGSRDEQSIVAMNAPLVSRRLMVSEDTPAQEAANTIIERVIHLFYRSDRPTIQVACIELLALIDVVHVTNTLQESIIYAYRRAHYSENPDLRNPVSTKTCQDLIASLGPPQENA